MELQQPVEMKRGGEPVLGLEGLREFSTVPGGIGCGQGAELGCAGGLGLFRRLARYRVDTDDVVVDDREE